MARSRTEVVILGAALCLIVLIGLSMYRWSYDVWAGIVLAPVLLVLSAPLLRRLLADDPHHVFGIVLVGLAVKLGGACARYYVAFDAYGKNADAERYFDTGNTLAAQVRGGRASVFDLLPLARDARFVERLTALVLAVIGPSRLAGFFVFSVFAYFGTVACVRAATMAIPHIAGRRYAAFCVLAPSLAFWPSSLGKEAWVMGCVGFFSLGVAKVVTWHGRTGGAVLAIAAGTGLAVVRPHFAAIFAGAAALAIAFGTVLGVGLPRRRSRGSLLVFTVVAFVGLIVASSAAVRFLDEDESTSGGLFADVGSILERTTEQTAQGGSAFEPISIDSPVRWPYAVVRTLTRPVINEAGSVATLLPALETTLYLGLLVLCWRRSTNLVPVLRRAPYLMYALVVIVLFGLAFSAIGNLGILVRQRSIVVPFLLVPLCLPKRGEPLDAAPPQHKSAAWV